MTAEELKSTVTVCMFDQYGTVVDMQGGLVEVATPFLRAKGWQGNPNSFVTWWRRTHFENSMIDALLHLEHTPYREIGERVGRLRDGPRRHQLHDGGGAGIWSTTSRGCGRFRRCPRRWTACAHDTGSWCCRTAIPTCWRRRSSITASTFERDDLGGRGQFLQAACRDLHQGSRDCSVCGWMQMLFVANHAFDCIGAKAAGMHTAFIDRRHRPFGETPHQPDMLMPSMTALADAIA